MKTLLQNKNTTRNKSAKVKQNNSKQNKLFTNLTNARTALRHKIQRYSYANYIKNSRRINKTGLTATCLLVLLILAICIPLYKDELNTKATTGTSNQATTSLAITTASNAASLDLLANNSSGTVATNDNALSFNVFTTNYTGYTLSIASPDNTTYNNGKLTNEIDNNCKSAGICPVLNTISSASSSITTNGTWGYKPSKLNSSANSNYLPSPTTAGTTIDTTTSANGATTSSTSSNATNYTIGLAAKANNTQAAGTYTNTYTLQAVGNPITYSITYSDNSGDSTVANLPYFNGNTSNHTQSGSTSTTNIVLKGTGTNNTDDATPTRTGYTFSKWCLGTVSNNGTTCTGTQYSAGDNFGIDQATLNTTTLYAIWTPATYDITLTNTNATTSGSTAARATFNSSTVYGGTSGTSGITAPQRKYSFSGFAKTNSAYNATVSSTTTKTYTYTFDGWYTASSGGTRVVTSSGALVASVSGYTNSSSQWIATSGVTLYAHWTAGTNQTLPTITQTDSTNGNGNCYWSSTNSTTGAQTYTSGATISSPAAGATLYGVCKFPVKITFAGTGVSSVAVKSGSATGTTVGTVSSSGGSVTDLTYGSTYYLVPTYTSSSYILDNWKKTSDKGVLDGDSVQNTTTTTANPTLTIGTTSTTGSVGITITGKNSKIYMQDLTMGDCPATGTTVYDSRDEKDYTVKLINGQCWMTQNLRFTETSILSATSNVATDKTLTYYSLNSSDSGDFGEYDDHCDSTNGYNFACIYDSGSASTGAWYNYAAASVGTITTSSNGALASQDICPKNWHLPSGPGTVEGTDLSILGGTTLGGWQTTAGFIAFDAVAGGYYANGAVYDADKAFWWSANASVATGRYSLYYDSSASYYKFLHNSSSGRPSGRFVRCVKDGGYMQDFTIDDAGDDTEYTLKDKRDNNIYTVKKINGQLWMTQNLRFIGTSLNSNTSNVAATYTASSPYYVNGSSVKAYKSLVNDSVCKGTSMTTNNTTNLCMYNSGNVSTGVWYNYAAASAGTITGTSNNTVAQYDICPKNWHLPTGPNATVSTDLNKLVGNTTSGYQNSTAGLSTFGAVAGGYYYNGSISTADYGYWWSATTNGTSLRYSLGYNSGNNQFTGNNSGYRNRGYFVRCVRSL